MLFRSIFKIRFHTQINKTGLFFCNKYCRDQAIKHNKLLFHNTKIIQCCKCGDDVEVDARASKIKCEKCRAIKIKRKITDYHKVIRGEETTTSYTALRLFLIKEGIKKNKCEECGTSKWQGKPLCIQLHHIDGNRKNNLLENLKMVCPNCHYQTKTWGVRNKNWKRNTLNVAQ